MRMTKFNGPKTSVLALSLFLSLTAVVKPIIINFIQSDLAVKHWNEMRVELGAAINDILFTILTVHAQSSTNKDNTNHTQSVQARRMQRKKVNICFKYIRVRLYIPDR